MHKVISSYLDQLIDLLNTDRPAASSGSIVVEDVTVTVGAGKAYATIQEAINYFVGKIVSGTCIIEVDAGVYAESLTFASILVMPGSVLWLKGDTRDLTGLTYTDNLYGANSEARTNGGKTDAACALANATTNITVTVTGGDPSFDSDGWGSGDTVLVLPNTKVPAEYTISSTSGKTITLTETAPTIGQQGTAICLCPNRVLIVDSGTAIEIQIQGVKITGFYVISAASTGYLVSLSSPIASLELGNIVIYKSQVGIYTIGLLSQIGGCISIWGTASYGIYAYIGAEASINYLSLVKCGTGTYAYCSGMITARYSKALSNTAGFDGRANSFYDVQYSSFCNNTVGVKAYLGAFIYALNCNARAYNNTPNSATDGLSGSYVYWS
jgi:hypothetical protein